MKLKRILAGILTGAVMITGIPVLGLEMTASVSVYADENSPEGLELEQYTNLAAGKSVKTSGVDTDSAGAVGANAVDNDTDTSWVSVNLRQESPQWIQIDLGEMRTSVDRIEVVYDGQVWDQNYDIYTYDSEKNEQRHKVKSITPAGPDSVVGEDAESRNPETKTDTIRRNNDGEKIVLRRYVNFNFTLAESADDDTEPKKASIAEIRIYGVKAQRIHGPSIIMAAPEGGKYPEIAKVYAPKQDEGVYHQTLADRTTPSATLIKRGSNQPEWGDYTLKESTGTVKVPVGTTAGEAAEFTPDPYGDDGVYGFTTDAQTPGIDNKFNVYGNDVKIISFQLYLKKDKLPKGEDGGHLDIFGKGDKLAMQVNDRRIYTYMHTARGRVAVENFWFAQYEGGADAYMDRWIDVLIVVDGLGKQRLYIDGLPAKSADPDFLAIAAEAPADKGMQPFTIGSNLADFTLPKDASGANMNYWDVPLNDVSRLDGIYETSFKDAGYIARLKFYSNKNYNGLENAAGTDISDARVLSSAFDNQKAENPFSIAALEQSVGADPNTNDGTGNESEENLAKRAEVYHIITNMLQKEEPTARISLCPYSRSTVWSKKTGDSWQEMDASEKFVSYTKYKATTILKADDGYIFDESCVETVLKNLSTGAEDAKSTARIADKERELTIVTYYNCTDADVEDTCRMDDILVGNDPIRLKIGDTEVPVGAEATGVGKCANHEDAVVEYIYELSKGETRVTLNAEKGTLSALESTKGILGYDPVTVTVTAVLKQDGKVVQAGGQDVKQTRTINVQVEPEETEDQIINTAPAVTVQAPTEGRYPQIAEIAISDKAKHFEDIADRMEPVATLEPLTQNYIRNSKYLTVENNTNRAEDAKYKDTSTKYELYPSEETIQAFENQPSIKNINGVWGFNAVGQTPGDTNKFDVFGDEIKLISFKLYLDKWPQPYPTRVKDQSGQWTMGTGSRAVDIYGKGNKYAVQVTSDKQLVMYMQNTAGDWPQETFIPAGEDKDEFLHKWHDVFMVVDGRGWQRLYVDGQASTTTIGRQGNAFARDPEPASANDSAETAEYKNAQRKPFTLGYNPKSKSPVWYESTFADYGYIADFEFYSNKNYSNVVNGSGNNISDAKVLPEEIADNINLQKLENTYSDSADISTILTNMLQTSNATAYITASPYVAKTNWYQETTETGADVEEGYKPLDKVNAEKFARSTSYRVKVELTAFDGFKFEDTREFKEAVEEKFKTAGGNQAEHVLATVENNETGEDKVLRITATYGKIPVPCTCGIESIAPQGGISIEIPAKEAFAVKNITPISQEAVKLAACQKEGHPVTENKNIVFTYSVAEADQDKLELIRDENDIVTGIKAKKAGTAVIHVKAEYQVLGQTVENDNHDKAEIETMITVNVTKASEGGTGGENHTDPEITAGTKLTAADGTGYQVVNAKDKTVTLIKGVDANTVTVGPTVTIDKVTYKVESIGNKAFYGLKSATKVIINANIVSIGEQAFANSKKLKSVTIGKDVSAIGKKAFFKCSRLSKVILKGKALTEKGIGKKAFSKTAKKSTVKWGSIKGKARTKLKKTLKKQGLKVK